MTAYLAALVIALIFSSLYEIRKNKILAYQERNIRYFKKVQPDKMTSIILAAASAIPLMLVMGLRYRVGTDYFYYAESFQKVSSGGNGYFKDILYCAMQYTVGFFTENYMWMSLACACVFTTMYWTAFYKLSNNMPFSIFLLLGTSTYFISLNGVRQGLSIAILFYSLVFIIEKRKKEFMTGVLCAMMFHPSAALFLPLYWLCNIRLTPKLCWLIMAVSVPIGFPGGKFFMILIAFTRYKLYYNSVFADDAFETIFALINLSVLGVMSFYYHKAVEMKDTEKYNMLYWLQLLSTVSIMMSASLPLAKRVTWIFSVGQILSLPMLSKYEDSKIGKTILIGGIILLFSLSIYIGIVLNGAHKVTPYQWIFLKEHV